MKNISQKFGKITFETRLSEGGPHLWEALIHQRACVWLGDTEEEAVANMLNGVAQLAASGHICPDSPDETGPIAVDPVQHCVGLLVRRLSFLTSECEDATRRIDDGGRVYLQSVRRTMGNIGTALASLCRVEPV